MLVVRRRRPGGVARARSRAGEAREPAAPVRPHRLGQGPRTGDRARLGDAAAMAGGSFLPAPFTRSGSSGLILSRCLRTDNRRRYVFGWARICMPAISARGRTVQASQLHITVRWARDRRRPRAGATLPASPVAVDSLGRSDALVGREMEAGCRQTRCQFQVAQDRRVPKERAADIEGQSQT